MQGNYRQSKRFLEDLKSTDKVGIVGHDDLDGFASSILFYNFCVSRGIKDIKHFTLSYGKTTLAQMSLEDRTKLLIADIAPNFLIKEISKFQMPILYTDHHQTAGQKFPLNVLELRTVDEGYVPSSRTVYQLCKGKKWWALLGVWGDTLGDFKRYKENKSFAQTALKEEGLSKEEFRNLWINAGNFLIYYAKDFERAFEFLTSLNNLSDLGKLERFSVEVEKEVQRVYADLRDKPELIGDVKFHYFESPFEIKSAVINKASMESKNEVLILACPKSKLDVGVSARNQTGNYNMITLLKNACHSIPDANTGGHKSAAGAIFKKEELSRFKLNLANIKLDQIKQ